MNHIATSKDALIDASIRLLARDGFSAVNMRQVAQEAGISVGCVYRYFPSKGELVAAAVARIWEGVFHRTACSGPPHDYCACVQQIFDAVQASSQEYPAFFAQHGTGFSAAERPEGRAVMDQYLAHIRRGMLQALLADTGVRADAFCGDFTPEALVDFTFDNLLDLCRRGSSSCGYLLQVLRRLLY